MSVSEFRLCHSEGMRGFQMTFDNGNTVSVQWGNGNYCNNRDLTPGSPAPRDACQTAEIAAWDSDDNWYDSWGNSGPHYCWRSCARASSSTGNAEPNSMKTTTATRGSSSTEEMAHRQRSSRWRRFQRISFWLRQRSEVSQAGVARVTGISG